jgi:hypothetical protein
LPSNSGTDSLVRISQTTCDPSLPVRFFNVEAWRAADLLPERALTYHGKRKIADPNAVIYVSAGERIRDAVGVDGVLPSVEVLVTRDASDLALLRSGAKEPEPLILRARAGECIEVELVNNLGAIAEEVTNPASWSWNMMPPITSGLNFNDVPASRTIGLHPQLLAVNTFLNDGSIVGNNPPSLAFPCDKSRAEESCRDADGTVSGTALETYNFDNTKTYQWYAGDWTKTPEMNRPRFAPIEFGVLGLQNFGDVIKGASHGAVGALIIEPAGSSWKTDCEMLRAQASVDEASRKACLNAAATVSTGPDSVFREFVLLYQNDVSARYRGEPLANLRNGDDAEDSGQKAFNYRSEPFWSRLNANPAADPEAMMDYDYTNVLSSKPEHGHGDPATPLFTVAAGTPVRFRVLEPAGHPRNGAFALSGHDWVNYPWTGNSTVQVADPGAQNRVGVVNGVGPGRHENVLLESAGGKDRIPGDYLYRTPLGFAFGGGQWGIMRVFDPASCASGVIRDEASGRVQVCR